MILLGSDSWVLRRVVEMMSKQEKQKWRRNPESPDTVAMLLISRTTIQKSNYLRS